MHTVHLCMMIYKSTFFSHTPRLVISVKERYPQITPSKPTPGIVRQSRHRLRYKSHTPIRFPYPISYLRITIRYVWTMPRSRRHQSATTHNLIYLLQHDCKRIWCGKHRADNFKTILHRRVRRPPRRSPHIRVLGVLIKRFGIIVEPPPQYQSVRFNNISHTQSYIKSARYYTTKIKKSFFL